MPFQIKIQPVNQEGNLRKDTSPVKPVVKSRLKRLLEKQLPCVLRIATTETKHDDDESVLGENQFIKDGTTALDFEPSSVCLAKMVQNFIEETTDHHHHQKDSNVTSSKGCNCFSGNSNESSDDEFDCCFGGSNDTISGDSSEILKSLVPCSSIAEKNLLADTSKLVEMNKSCKLKSEYRKIVSDGLLALGYNVGICKSKWDKSPSYPAGDYEYIDVIIESERIIVDTDFRSEFEIARPTGNYKAVLQCLPAIFIAKTDRLQQIVSVVSEAAKVSLKKKGLHFPPWRKTEYMRAKWLSTYTRSQVTEPSSTTTKTAIVTKSSESEILDIEIGKRSSLVKKSESSSSEFELLFTEKSMTTSTGSDSCDRATIADGSSDDGMSSQWSIVTTTKSSKSCSQGGLASVLEEKL